MTIKNEVSARQRDSGGCDGGAIAIVFAIFVVVFMVLLAFVVDLGRVYSEKARIQNAADAGALAGAQVLNCAGSNASAAIAEATSYARDLNQTQLSAVPVVSGTEITVGTRTTDFPLVFGPFVNRSKMTLSATATAAKTCTQLFQVFGENTVTMNGNDFSVGAVYAGSSFVASGNSANIIIASVTTAGPASNVDVKDKVPDFPITPNTNLGTAAQYAASIGIDPTKINAVKAAFTAWSGSSTPYACSFFNTTWQSVVANKTKAIWCTGNLVVDVAGLSGSIVADGQIDLKKNYSTWPDSTDLVYTSGTAGVVFYSIQTDAVIYAPNGPITNNGQGARLTGQVIAKTVTFNGTEGVAAECEADPAACATTTSGGVRLTN